MAKRKKKTKKQNDLLLEDEMALLSGKRLESADFWEWQCKVKETMHSKDRAKIKELEYKVLTLQLENLNMTRKLFGLLDVKEAESQVKIAKRDYEGYLEQLEAKVGFKLRDCVIDPVTYEVKSEEELKSEHGG